MRVLLDVNVVIDVLARRAPFFTDSYAVLQLVAAGTLDGFITAGSVADIDYILRRQGLDRHQSRAALASLTQVVSVEDTRGTDVTAALGSAVPDLEDAILASAAWRLGADAIVTRDQRDFAHSPVPAMTPAALLAAWAAAPDTQSPPPAGS